MELESYASELAFDDDSGSSGDDVLLEPVSGAAEVSGC